MWFCWEYDLLFTEWEREIRNRRIFCNPLEHVEPDKHDEKWNDLLGFVCALSSRFKHTQSCTKTSKSYILPHVWCWMSNFLLKGKNHARKYPWAIYTVSGCCGIRIKSRWTMLLIQCYTHCLRDSLCQNLYLHEDIYVGEGNTRQLFTFVLRQQIRYSFPEDSPDLPWPLFSLSKNHDTSIKHNENHLLTLFERLLLVKLREDVFLGG